MKTSLQYDASTTTVWLMVLEWWKVLRCSIFLDHSTFHMFVESSPVSDIAFSLHKGQLGFSNLSALSLGFVGLSGWFFYCLACCGALFFTFLILDSMWPVFKHSFLFINCNPTLIYTSAQLCPWLVWRAIWTLWWWALLSGGAVLVGGGGGGG